MATKFAGLPFWTTGDIQMKAENTVQKCHLWNAYSYFCRNNLGDLLRPLSAYVYCQPCTMKQLLLVWFLWVCTVSITAQKTKLRRSNYQRKQHHRRRQLVTSYSKQKQDRPQKHETWSKETVKNKNIQQSDNSFIISDKVEEGMGGENTLKASKTLHRLTF